MGMKWLILKSKSTICSARFETLLSIINKIKLILSPLFLTLNTGIDYGVKKFEKCGGF